MSSNLAKWAMIFLAMVLFAYWVYTGIYLSGHRTSDTALVNFLVVTTWVIFLPWIVIFRLAAHKKRRS